MGDLISRSALKKAFEDTVCIEPMPYAFVKQIIDNAPTIVVGYLTNCQNCVSDYSLGYDDGYKEGYKAERPTGKWIFHKDYNERKYGCNQCGNLNNIPSNFCPNCGAKMDKKEADNDN